MKVILRADVDNLGRLGEIHEVKNGYGRNYLIPKGLAMPASQGNLKQFELERAKLQKKMDAIRTDAQSLADRIAEAQVTISVRVGEGDKLYGSVTSTQIAENLADQGVQVDRRKIVLDEPIRALGDYVLEVKIHPDVQAELKVSVVTHDAQPESETE